MKKLSYVLAAGLLVFGLPSCCEKDTPVIPKEITSLEVKPSAVVMQIGETKSLEVTWEPQDIEVTPVFSSDKAEVASVDDKGVITAVAEGEAVITVKAGKLEKTVSVSVSKSLDPNEITSLSVTPQEVSLKVGETEQLTATWEPQTATPEVTYESDKAEVASVDDKGLITAVAEGEANITVKAGKLTASVKVTIEPKEDPNEITSLSVTPQEVSLKVGETQQLTATWEPQTATPEVTYESDKAEVASVDADGLITAVAEGEANITVKAGKLTASARVLVSAGQIQAVTQMPLLKFTLMNDNGEIDDPDILAYEEKVGRKPANFSITSSIGPHNGFRNDELSLIPGVIYGTLDNNKDYSIFAVCKESTSSYPETRTLLADLGFTDLKEEDYYGSKIVNATHDTNPDITLIIVPLPVAEMGGQSIIGFKKKSTTADVEVVNYQHAVIPDAEDFPSLEKLLTKDEMQIRDFETQLGFRDYNNRLAHLQSYLFETKKEKEAESNMWGVTYVCAPNTGEPPHLHIILNCIQNEKDMEENADLKAWLSHNGFENIRVEKEADGKKLRAENPSTRAKAEVYISKEFQMCFLQVTELQNETTSAPYYRPERSMQQENDYWQATYPRALEDLLL